MKNNLMLFGGLLVLIAIAGCTYEKDQRPAPGQYTKNSNTTNSSGTQTKQKTSTNISYDKYGNQITTIDKKTSTDPEGLFNKTTTETHQTVK